MDVAQTAAPTLGDQNLFLVDIKVGDDLVAVDVGDNRADGHMQADVIAAPAVAIAGRAFFAALSDKFTHIAEFDQRVQIAIGNEIDASSASAIAAIWSTFRLIFLATERGDAVAAVSSSNEYFRFVDKFHDARPMRISVRTIKKALPPG